MDRDTIFKQIDLASPLEHFQQIYGDISLTKWMDSGFGDTLCKCLLEVKKKDINIFEKYLAVINALIPPIPNDMEIEPENSLKFLHNSGYCIDIKLLDRLISKILGPLCRLYIRGYQFRNILFSTLLRVVFYASEASINDCFMLSECVLYCMENQLVPFCRKMSHDHMAILIILSNKMSEAWFLRFLKPNIIFKIRHILMRNEMKICPYLDCLRTLYERLNLEKKLEMEVPKWLPLLELKNNFNEQCLTETLRFLAQVIEVEGISVQQFIQSEIMHKLQSLLSNPSEVGQTTLVIKSFLTSFVKFEATDNHHVYDSYTFKNLTYLVGHTLEYLINTLTITFHGKMNMHDKFSLSAIDRFEKDIIIAINLMQSLYVLNGSWYQWFDIEEKNELIDVKLFNIINVYRTMQDLLEAGTTKLSWLIEVLQICPGVVWYPLKKQMLMKTVPIERASITVRVSRNNVLRDIFEIFQQNERALSSDWNFTFKDEIGFGAGVTKEVYSTLSRELQRHDTNLWQGEPLKRSENEMTYTHSPNGLFPKSSEETQNFCLLGQIMAKAILDGHFLNIPLSDEFFEQLRRSQQPHLRKEYYGLVQSFPLLASIFNQLLPVKRKVDTIRLETNLSDRQKNEIINNLTFDDGSSFDDLCLNFTVPGTDIELIEGGRDVTLSPHNIDLYFEKLCAYKRGLDPLKQFEAIRDGFDKVLTPGVMNLFYPKEAKTLICCDKFQLWTMEDLHKYCRYPLDYSKSVKFLFECLVSFNAEEQRLFLKFVTSMTALPFGGLSTLIPPLTISRIKRDYPDSTLPTAATCFNRLYLPAYSSLHVTKAKLLYAITHANNNFSLV